MTIFTTNTRIRFSAEEKNDPKSVLLHLRGAFNLRGNATYELGEQEAYDCFKKLEEQDIHRHPKDIRKFEKTKSALWWAATSLKRYKEQNGLPLETPEL